MSVITKVPGSRDWLFNDFLKANLGEWTITPLFKFVDTQWPIIVCASSFKWPEEIEPCSSIVALLLCRTSTAHRVILYSIV